MQKNIFIFIIVFILPFSVIAQQLNDDLTRLENGEDVNVLYRHERSFGIYAHSSNGIGLAFRKGIHVTGKRKRMYEIEVQNFKHPKEIKLSKGPDPSSPKIIYGKLNSFLLIRPGIGYQNILFEKADKKSIEIRLSYFVGATLALGKPTYLEVSYPGEIIATERYKPGSYNDTISNVYGRSSFFTGIQHTRIYPGGYAKLALSVDYANRYNKVKALEVGTLVDVYPTPLPMMAHIKNEQFYIQLYLKFLWGKKTF